MNPYRENKPMKKGCQYKVINVHYRENAGWKRQLELELQALSQDECRPILYSDAGGGATVILERPYQEKEED
jgi:hypothetical protein